MPVQFDAVVVGAGAAGLMCASVAGQRGLRVALIDHSPKLAEKIRISGGGRCNFTNLQADRPDRFISAQPTFARAALRAYPPRRFIDLVTSHRISFHEKHRGQLFCDDSSDQIINMLRIECERAGVKRMQPCAVHEVGLRASSGLESVESGAARFVLLTDAGELECASLVVATGGLSIPAIGATDWGFKLARQFGHALVPTRPALVPLTFTAQSWQPFAELAGLALEVDLRIAQRPQAPVFREDLLFTHRGLSGPAMLQGSSYWEPGDAVSIDLAPGRSLAAELFNARQGARQQLGNALASIVPKRLAHTWLIQGGPDTQAAAQQRLAELSNKAIESLAVRFQDWRVTPAGTEGWRKAEVTAGGVATEELEPRSLQSRRIPGLHFIGEVVDVTGWLGGYNFQWAWASGWAAGQALRAS